MQATTMVLVTYERLVHVFTQHQARCENIQMLNVSIGGAISM